MQKKIIAFVCAIVGIVLALSVVTAVQNRSEYTVKESKIEPAVKHLIEIFNNADEPEYKTMYWEFLSEQTKNILISQSGSEDAAKSEVWIMLQEVVELERQVEFLALEFVDIQGDVATVVIRVKISESGGEPVETSTLHKYRWENGEWKFIDWLIEPEMYKR